MKFSSSSILSSSEQSWLSSIVCVGNSTFQDFIRDNSNVFSHSYISELRGRFWTKIVQMECEIESHMPGFPFQFCQQRFSHGQTIPELRTDKVTIHVARSSAPDILPSSANYKIEKSWCNHPIKRQLILDFDAPQEYSTEPLYGILVFGGRTNHFAVVQFPEPGYNGIAETIMLPQIIEGKESDVVDNFERKKAVLKQEFIDHIQEVGIS